MNHIDYGENVRKAIWNAFIKNQVWLQIQAAGWYTPHVITYVFALTDPEHQQQIAAVLDPRMSRTVEAAIGAELSRHMPAIRAVHYAAPVRITQRANLVMVDVPNPWYQPVMAVDLPAGVGVVFPIGIGEQVEYVNLAQPPHVLAVGPTRRGKTNAMRSMLYWLARQNPARRLGIVVFCAPAKLADWKVVAGLRHTLALVTDTAETLIALTWLADLAAGRIPWPVNAPNGWQARPRLVILVDDAADLIDGSPSIAGPLGRIASLGGGVGVHLIIGTQSAGKRGSTVLFDRNNPWRLGFGASSAQDAVLQMGIGGTGAERIGVRRGDALLRGDGDQVMRVATGLVRDEDLAGLAQSAVTWRPWCAPDAPVTLARESAVSAVQGAKTLPFPTGAYAPVQDTLPLDAPWNEKRARLLVEWEYTGGKTNETLRRVGWKKAPRTLAWLHQALAEAEVANVR